MEPPSAAGIGLRPGLTPKSHNAYRRGLYLYLLIEFQSNNDHFMANRAMTYTGLLHQDIIRAHQLKCGDKLPPITPIALYNGREPWTGPQDVKDLIHPADTPNLCHLD